MKQKRNKAQEYILRYKKIHGDKYKYSSEIYSSLEDISIECPVHGLFKMQAYRHLRHGCPKCGPRGDSFKTFTDRANEKFNHKFSYLKDTFSTAQEPMTIICPVHGEFRQALYTHIRSAHGCPKCGFNATATHCSDDLNSFLEKAKEKHNDKYDYSKVIYTGSLSKVIITCPDHGDFEQIPSSHIRGRGCPKCGFEQGSKIRSYTPEEFYSKVKEIQGDTYDFSKMNYVDFNTKVKVICRVHGEFFKSPRDLLKNSGCSKCSGNYSYTTEEYVALAKKAHGDKYDYSKTKYTRAHTKITITCPDHGDFEQNPSGHLTLGYGCPKCIASKGEIAISSFLDKYKIKYITEYKIPNNRYKYDFFLPEYNIYIEFHGKQHYEYNHFFHRTYSEFLERRLIDDIKIDIAKAHGGKYIVVNYQLLDLNLIEQYLKKRLKLFGITLIDSLDA